MMASSPSLFPKPLPAEFRELRTLCQTWLQFVIRVGRIPRRERMDFVRGKGEEYATVHSRLVAECERISAVEAGEMQEFIVRFGDLVRPWSTLESLTYQPPNILRDLVQRSTAVERAMHCPSRAPDWVRKAAIWIFLAAFATLAVPAVWKGLFPAAPSLYSSTVEAQQSISLFLDRATEKEQTAALTVIIITSGIAILWSSRRY